MSRLLNYCVIAALWGRRAADVAHDRVTPPLVDMDFGPDQEAQARRAQERAAQEAMCGQCQHACQDDVPEGEVVHG